jgi:hypothetical protein
MEVCREKYPQHAKRTHIVIPDQLAHEIDAVVGKRGRSSFLVSAAERELRLRLRAIERVAGLRKAKNTRNWSRVQSNGWPVNANSTSAVERTRPAKWQSTFSTPAVIIDILNGKRNRPNLLKDLIIEGNTFGCCSGPGRPLEI